MSPKRREDVCHAIIRLLYEIERKSLVKFNPNTEAFEEAFPKANKVTGGYVYTKEQMEWHIHNAVEHLVAILKTSAGLLLKGLEIKRIESANEILRKGDA